MINKNNIEKLYECLIDGKELTTKELKQIGFSSSDLTKLVKDGTLSRIKRGFYTLSNVDDLYFYGKKLISLKKYEKATLCFEKCYEIDPKHPNANFQLFLREVNNKDYQLAFKKLDILLNNSNPHYKKDALFYLYLLNIITEIPEKYKPIISNLNYDDIKVSSLDKRFRDVFLQNKIRLSVFNQNLPLALRQINENMMKSSKITVVDILTKKLIVAANEIRIENNKILLDLIKNKKYEEIVNLLKGKEQKHFALNEYEYNILNLTKLLLELINGNKISKTDFKATTIYDAIKIGNYELALKLCIQKSDKYLLNKDEYGIYLLLVDLNNLIEKVSGVKANETKQELKTKDKTQNHKLTVTEELIDYALKELLNNNLDSAFRAIYSYLSIFDKNEYEFLVINLIKLDLIQKDYTFSRTINILKDLSSADYYFDENEYIKCLYECIKENKQKEADIYLDIVSKRNEQLKYLEFETKDEKYKYYRKLAISRISVATKTLGINYSKFLDTIKKSSYPLNRFELGNLVVTNSDEFIKLTTGETFKTIERQADSNKTFIENKVAELKEGKGFVIIGKMNDEKIGYVKKIIEKIPDVAYFIVGTGDIKTIAIKHRRTSNSCRNLKPMIKESIEAYNIGDYEKCINLQKEILALGKPKASVFAKIGLSYMRQSKIKTAIKYLSMATELGKQEKTTYDFSDLIDLLNGKSDKYAQKNALIKKIKMSEQDFIQDETYGITNFSEIYSLVFSGMSISDACIQFNLTEEQINIVKLIFARIYYANEDYITGDIIINNVERSNRKTPFIIKLINELRTNKRFYKNRKTTEEIFVKKSRL